MATLLPDSKQSYTTATGAPLVGGRLYTYDAGTSTPRPTYSDAAGLVPNTNPVILDARGEAVIFWSGSYKATLKDAADAVIWTVDNIVSSEVLDTAMRADLANSASATKGPTLVAFTPTLGYVASTIGAAMQDSAVNLLWFCTQAQRVAIKAKTYADDHTSLLAAAIAWAAGRAVYLPGGGYKVSAYTIAQAGQVIYGDGWGASVIRATDPTLNLFSVTGNDVTIRDIELQGADTTNTNATFAVFTSTATPPKRLRLHRVKFSGATSASGFNNGIKYDDGCLGGEVIGCHFEYLYGSTSGRGYGVLCGAATDIHILDSLWYGSSGRGRHGFYLSAGAKRCIVRGNLVDAPDFEGITIYSQGAQPPCADNIVAYNRVISPTLAQATLNGSGISVFGHALRNKLIGNIITGSAGCGIKLDGTGFVDLTSTEIIGNTIINSGFIGIDAVAAVGGTIVSNTVTDSSQSSAGTYANIRLVSDGATGCSSILIGSNRIPTSTVARCAVQLNATAPVPTGIKIDGNLAGSGTVTDYDLLSGGQAVDGRIRFAQAFDPVNIANGAANTTPWTVAGAVVGDIVTVTHSSNSDGCSISGYVSAANTVSVSILNNSGGAKDIATGTLYIDVWKRTP